MKRKLIWISVFAGILVFFVKMGWCEDQDDEEKVYAVQNKVFHRYHEIDILTGYGADDDFFHLYPIGGGYTYHLNEHFSWEAVRAQYFLTQDKDLKNTLAQEFDVQPQSFPEPKYMIHSHITFKPLYGKDAVLNRGVINHEIYFFGGGGLVHNEWQYSTGEKKTENAFSVSLGAGMRYFLSERFCINFEIRDLVHFRENDTENNVMFGFSFGYRFNLGPRKVEEDQTMKRLKRILDED